MSDSIQLPVGVKVAYNVGMTKPEEHTRRDFLRGRAAAHTLAAQTQAWVDSAAELLSANFASGPIAHVHASRRAMACEFAVQYHQADSENPESDIQEQVLAAFDLVEHIEDQLTIYRGHSEVIEINQHATEGAVKVDAELFSLLLLCQQLHLDTSGAFDITSGPLSRVWGFLQHAGRLPESSEIVTALKQVGGRHILLDSEAHTVRFLRPGLEINFNAIGKGYALDRAAELLRTAGHDDFLWHGGGSSVLAQGVNRASADRCWTLGLRDPLKPKRRLAEFHLRDRALATAGGATQFFEHEGLRYSHVLDPRTGWPAEGVFSATVLAPSAAAADGLATAFFVLDVEAVEQYCLQHPEIGVLLVCSVEKHSGYKLRSFGLCEEEWSQLA